VVGCGWHTPKRYVRGGEREYVEEKGPTLEHTPSWDVNG
jgi:hypothetical protein